jgi:predicted transposase/invertase (TIGR01784 family)
VEELLVRRFSQLDREEVRKMFHFPPLRETKSWQEAHEEGREEGKSEARQDVVRRCLAKGMSAKEIAELLDVTVKEVRRLAKQAAK